MAALVTPLLSLCLACQLAWVSQYDPGVMEGVIPRQQRYGNLPATLPIVDGFVAGSDCRDIGQLLWLRPVGAPTWEVFMIADCPHNFEVRHWMLLGDGTLPIIAEVDGQTAMRWGLPRRRGAKVEWTADPCVVTSCY